MEHQTLAFQEQMQHQILAFQEKMEQQTLALSGGLARLPACPMARGPLKQKTIWAPRKCGREAKNNSFCKTHKQNSPLPQGPCFGVRHPFLGIYCRRNSTSQTAGGRISARRNGVLSTSFELPIISRCFTSKPSGH
ncbi:hypothetical protein AVEN_33205-1 [Araneus ventricosus]|uniref:Uncharacterized protein n=1 Tax=Araneus ventricosus TaxID=182803 RepID=A0A4Y2RZN3_ARAVE|nr:hypothetical protein AVEN_33205-1 [Araneus ventricosus]